MIKKVLIICLLLVTSQLQAQVYKKVKKVVSILENETFTVSRSSGVTRKTIPFNLPKNTVEWYYVFGSTPIDQNTLVIDLASQLRRIIDPTGMTPPGPSTILVPFGSAFCHVYLLKPNDVSNFKKNRIFDYYRAYSKIRKKNASVNIKNANANSFSLGFLNPSFNNEIKVTVSVAAIVEENILSDEWSPEVKSKFYQSFYEYFSESNRDQATVKKLATCYTNHIVTNYSYSQWFALSDQSRHAHIKRCKCAPRNQIEWPEALKSKFYISFYEHFNKTDRNDMLVRQLAECYTNHIISNFSYSEWLALSIEGRDMHIKKCRCAENYEVQWSEGLKSKIYMSFYDRFSKSESDEIIRKELAECYTEHIVSNFSYTEWYALSKQGRQGHLKRCKCDENYDIKRSPQQKKAISQGNLAWEYYENGSLDKAIEQSHKALSIDNSKDLGFVKSNLGLFYLVKNQQDKASEYYLDALSNLSRNKLTAQAEIGVMKRKLRRAKKKYRGSLSGYKVIKGLLKKEYRKRW